MGKRRLAVMQRRQVLLEKIAIQREQLAEIGSRWQPGLQVADQAVLAMGFMRSHPVLLAGLAGLVVVRRRGLAGLLRGTWRVWKAYRFAREFSKKIRL
ncbi:MAG: YqjK-like family protein [Gallionella sp.]|jgi:hypothetical protein